MKPPIVSTVEGYGFHPTGEAAHGRSLFVVNPGVPIEDAMESLSELLSSAGEPCTPPPWANAPCCCTTPGW